MINETIGRIEQRIKSNDSLTEDNKRELLAMIGTVEREVAALAKTHHEAASSIAGYTETSVHEATRGEKNPELLKHSIDGLSLSVRQYEVSHPGLVGIINAIGQTLWKMGI